MELASQTSLKDKAAILDRNVNPLPAKSTMDRVWPCLFPECFLAFAAGMVSIVMVATVIAYSQRRQSQKAIDRREALIKELNSRDD